MRVRGRGRLRRKIKCPHTIRELFETGEESRREGPLEKNNVA